MVATHTHTHTPTAPPLSPAQAGPTAMEDAGAPYRGPAEHLDPLGHAVVHELPLLISVGAVACAALGGMPLAGLEGMEIDDCVLNLHRLAGVGDGSDPLALQAAIASALSILGTRMQGPRTLPTVLVVDTACPAGRAVGLAVAQALHAQQWRTITVGLSARLHQGKGAVPASLQAFAQLQALSSGSLLIDGRRFGALDSPVPYLQHACRTLLLATDLYGHVNVNEDDVIAALRGRRSHMAHAVVQRAPWVMVDVMEQLLAGTQLRRSELQCATAVLVLVEAQRGQHRLAETREIIAAIARETLPDVHMVYSSAYADRPEGELGITLLASY